MLTPVWTTRRWLAVGVGAALVVLTVIGILGAAVATHCTRTTDHLVNTSTPARVDAARLETELVVQESRVHGFTLTGDHRQLVEYRRGVERERRLEDRLHRMLEHDDHASGHLEQVVRCAARWRTAYPEPVLAAPAERRAEVARGRAAEERDRFAELRAALVLLREHLDDTGADTDQELSRASATRNRYVLAGGALVSVLAALVFVGLHRGVGVPLHGLSQGVRRVSRGEFDHPITPSGPLDLRRLADDVDGMRRRLAEELAFADQARHRLDVQARELRRSNAELEQFAYAASHDLQEPLRKVSGFCDLLYRRYADQLDDRGREYARYAVDGAVRMRELINDLLALSRVGRPHSERTPVDLEQVLTTATEGLALAMEEARAQVTHDPLPHVVGDRTQLGMLFQNLVANAVKFRRPGHPPRIHVSALRQGDIWHFAVTDDGIGIEAEHAERVFAVFQRLHPRDAFPGNGIGLALCRKVVECHGGTIEVDPQYRGGTRIRWTLPTRAPTLPSHLTWTTGHDLPDGPG